MKCPPPTTLESLVLGELTGERRARVAAHGVECAACAREIAWLREEQRLVHARAASRGPLPAFEAVLARSQALAPRHVAPWRASLALGLCAAAAAVALVGPRSFRSAVAPGVAGVAADARPPAGAAPSAGGAAAAVDTAPSSSAREVCWDNGAPMSCAGAAPVAAAVASAPSEATCSGSLSVCDCSSCECRPESAGSDAEHTCDEGL